MEIRISSRYPSSIPQKATGLFRMSWVGLVQPDTLLVKPVAFWGIEEGYLDEIRISMADISEGQGPVGMAIRKGRHCICKNIEKDASMAPWRTQAVTRGYRSLGAFPLIVGSETIGAIIFYSQETDFFDAENIQMLKSVAAILSFALESAEREQKRRQAEKALEENEANYRELVESGNSIILRLDPRGNITFINQFAQQFFGYSKEKSSAKTWWAPLCRR